MAFLGLPIGDVANFKESAEITTELYNLLFHLENFF